MSGPYDSYGSAQYNQGSQYPAGGFAQPQYPPQQPYPQQGYGQQPAYGYQDQQSFGPPRRADSFGPPQAGGFQHGQAGMAYGAYDASNPQGHSGYYSGQPSHGGHGDAFGQNQAYQQQMAQSGAQAAWTEPSPEHQFSPQSSDPNAPMYDPNAPAMNESDRGFMGAVGGGLGGHFLGKKAGHGFLGTIGGAILGSLAEDKAKESHKKHKHHGHHSSQSSWGGSGSGRY